MNAIPRSTPLGGYHQKGRIAAAHGRFSSIRHVSAVCNHLIMLLGPPESSAQTASRLVQPFCAAHSRMSSGIAGHVISPKSRLRVETNPMDPHLILYMVPWSTRVLNSNGISIGSAVLQGSVL